MRRASCRRPAAPGCLPPAAPGCPSPAAPGCSLPPLLAAALALSLLHLVRAGASVQLAPANITVSFLSPTAVRVSWSAAAALVEKYDVTYKPSDARVVLEVAGNSDAVVLSGLEPATQYQVTVAALQAGRKLRSRPIVFRTLEPPVSSAQQDGAMSSAPRPPSPPEPTFPTIRGVEIAIVVLVLAVWVGAIALFFNRWGKIRMLLPYQPDYKQEQLKVPGSSALAAATSGACAHSAPSACSDVCCLLDRCFQYPRRSARDCGCQFALLHAAQEEAPPPPPRAS